MQRRQLLKGMAGAALGSAFGMPAFAQSGAWPTKPVKVVNPYTPGGTTEVIVRLMAERLDKAFGQPFVMDYRPGAGGSVGSGYVATQPADGHTILISNTGPLAVGPSLFPNLNYDVTKSFSYITLFGGAPILLAVKADSPIKTLADYVAATKVAPDAVTYGSSGIGSVGHLAGVLFMQKAGVTFKHVPYKGAPEAQQGVLSGEITALWDTIGAHAAQIRAGALRPLAISGPDRLSVFPNIPTIKELGYPDVVATNWFLFAGPAGLSNTVAGKINDVCQTAMKEAVVQERFSGIGLAPLGNMSSAEIAKFVALEAERWAPVVKASGAKPA
ncbi:MAG: tripartite tricarboxylate transporter substrate binding protein [Moraxellaceae bacterium]|nr:tripartite tricarboxylate transporter substrate binding protein [Moraxellaceae bacterium]